MTLRVFYINLDNRPDRRGLVEAEIAAYVAVNKACEVERFPAVPGGYAGCVRSHQRVAETFLSKSPPTPSALVLEDDFMWTVPVSEAAKAIASFLEGPLAESAWGFVQICHSPTTLDEHSPVATNEPGLPIAPSEPGSLAIHRVYRAANAGGYLLSRAAAEALIPIWNSAANALERGGAWSDNANDVVWSRIRKTLPCYAFVPRLGRQRAGVSDLEKRHVDYG